MNADPISSIMFELSIPIPNITVCMILLLPTSIPRPYPSAHLATDNLTPCASSALFNQLAKPPAPSQPSHRSHASTSIHTQPLQSTRLLHPLPRHPNPISRATNPAKIQETPARANKKQAGQMTRPRCMDFNSSDPKQRVIGEGETYGSVGSFLSSTFRGLDLRVVACCVLRLASFFTG